MHTGNRCHDSEKIASFRCLLRAVLSQQQTPSAPRQQPALSMRKGNTNADQPYADALQLHRPPADGERSGARPGTGGSDHHRCRHARRGDRRHRPRRRWRAYQARHQLCRHHPVERDDPLARAVERDRDAEVGPRLLGRGLGQRRLGQCPRPRHPGRRLRLDQPARGRAARAARSGARLSQRRPRPSASTNRSTGSKWSAAAPRRSSIRTPRAAW